MYSPLSLLCTALKLPVLRSHYTERLFMWAGRTTLWRKWQLGTCGVLREEINLEAYNWACNCTRCVVYGVFNKRGGTHQSGERLIV